eukprot:g13360.t1
MPFRLSRLLLLLTLLLLPVCVAYAQENDTDDVVQPEEPGETVGWLVLQGALREGPIREAWITEAEAGPSLRSVLNQIETVKDGEHYLGLVVYLDMPYLTATQTDAIYQALYELRESGKTVVTFAQAYSTSDYVLASAGDIIALQNKGMVELSGMHIEEMYLAGLMDKVGIQPNFIQVGKYKGAAESMSRTGPSEEWSQNMDGLLDGMYDTMVQRIADGRGESTDKVEKMMELSWTLDDRGLLKAGVVDRLCGRDLIEVTETEFGDEFVWDTEMGQTFAANPMAAAMAANPMMMIAALMQDPVTQTQGPTIKVIHANGAIVSGDSDFGGGFGGGESIGSRTIDEMLDDALHDDNVKGVVLRIDSPGGSALASEVMWQAIRAFGEEKPIVCSVGGMAASGGYYIASACDEILIEPRSIVGSIGVVAGKLNLKGLYELVGIGVHTRSRGPNASILSSVDNFTEEETQKLTASMELVYEQFRDRVATGRGARLKDLDAVDEGMLFTGMQAVESGMADQLGGVQEAIALVAKKAELEEGSYAVMELPHPVSLATYLEEMLSGGGGLPFGLSSTDQAATLKAVKALVGDTAWTQIMRSIHGVTLLRDEQVLLLMPQPIVVNRFAVGDASGGRASASKIEFELMHKPVFLRTIELFHGRADVGQIILAVHPKKLDDFSFRWADQLAFLGVKLIAGGETERWQTVQLALTHVADDATHIAVHDAARPCASQEMIDRVFEAAEQCGAALPGLPMSDTVKRVGEPIESAKSADPFDAIFDSETPRAAAAHPILETVPRHDLYRVQTPQAFERKLITEAYAALTADNAEDVTDDASVAERAGYTVHP